MVSLLTAFLSLIWRFFLFYFQSSHQQQLNTKYGSHPATVDIDILTYNFFLQIKLLLLLSQLVLLVQQVQVHYDFFYFNDAGSGHAVPAHHHCWNERSLYGRVLFIALSCAQDEITPHHTTPHQTHTVSFLPCLSPALCCHRQMHFACSFACHSFIHCCLICFLVCSSVCPFSLFLCKFIALKSKWKKEGREKRGETISLIRISSIARHFAGCV